MIKPALLSYQNIDIYLEDKHGGDLSNVMIENRHIKDWIDLSTGINPNAYNKFNIDSTIYSNLPSDEQLEELMVIAKKYYKLNQDTEICAYQGAQGIINIIPNIIDHVIYDTIQIQTPTYTEHYRVWNNNGFKINLVTNIETELDPSMPFVLVNPNNPDGKLIQPGYLEHVWEEIKKANGLLIIDESFMDATPDMSLSFDKCRDNIIVIRSFGKFFGLPGLRLGFAYGDNDYIDRISNCIGPWPISTSSLQIASKAMSDNAWIKNAITNLKIKSEALSSLLRDQGLNIIGDCNFFKLIEVESAADMNRALVNRGIWTRIFKYNHKWLRMGLTKNKIEFEYLANTMKDIL